MDTSAIGTETPPSTALRLFTGTDDAAPSTQPGQTLADFYADYFRPVCLIAQRAAPATVDQYDVALRAWIQATGDPPLAGVDGHTGAAFIAAASERPGRHGPLSPNTVRKLCRHLQRVLDTAGPQTRQNRLGSSAYGLFGPDEYGRPRPSPYLPAPPARDKLPTDSFTRAEVSAWLDAAGRAKQPRLPTCRAGAWWEALIRMIYHTGLRIHTALALRRDWITRTEAGDGWLAIPPDSYKGGRPKLIYASTAALDAIGSIPTLGVVFPWPHSPKHLHDLRRRQLEAAGLPEARRFGFHGLRKALGSALWALDPDAATRQLGHTDQATTVASYASPEVLGPALVAQMRPTAARIEPP